MNTRTRFYSDFFYVFRKTESALLLYYRPTSKYFIPILTAKIIFPELQTLYTQVYLYSQSVWGRRIISTTFASCSSSKDIPEKYECLSGTVLSDARSEPVYIIHHRWWQNTCDVLEELFSSSKWICHGCLRLFAIWDTFAMPYRWSGCVTFIFQG